MNLKTLLKAFGINVTAEHIAAVERLIPLLPGKVNELITWNVAQVREMREQLNRIERKLDDSTRSEPTSGANGYGHRTIAAAAEHGIGPVAAD